MIQVGARGGGLLRPCPPNEDCSPNKVTSSVPLECSLGHETPEILVINSVFVGKNRFFADFAMRTFFTLFWSSSLNTWNFENILRRRPFFNLFIFLVFIPRICGISWIFHDENLFYGLLSRIRRKKVFVPSQKLFMPPKLFMPCGGFTKSLFIA